MLNSAAGVVDEKDTETKPMILFKGNHGHDTITQAYPNEKYPFTDGFLFNLTTAFRIREAMKWQCCLSNFSKILKDSYQLTWDSVEQGFWYSGKVPPE